MTVLDGVVIQETPRELQGCYKGVTSMLQVCSKYFASVFQDLLMKAVVVVVVVVF
jgi:hypothetical protein